MSDITKSSILNTLKKTDDPDFNRDYLILNSIRKVDAQADTLVVDILLPLSNTKSLDRIKSKFKDEIEKEYPSYKNININVEAKISSHHDEKKEALLPGVKNTIAVASGKGGVGKSTVAVNLAVALAKDGAKVGLIDADIYGPSIPLMLGINEKPKIYQSKGSMKMIPLENFGIKLMSIGFLIDENTPVIWRGPMASGAVKQFMTDVEWEDLDYLLFDMPPGTGDIQLTLVQTIPLTGAVIVTTPQEVSLIDARKGLKMFSRVNVPVFGIVENMSYFIAPDTGNRYDIFGTGGGEKLSQELGVPFLGGIPIDQRIRVSGDKGLPVVFDAPDTEHAKIIQNISRNLAAQINVVNLSSTGSKIDISYDEE